MSRNDATPKPLVRAPRGAVLLNGQAVPYVEFEVNANAFQEADTASVVLAASALAKGMTVASLIALDQIEIELKAGFPSDPDRFAASDLETLFIGRVDNFSVDPIGGELRMSARDLTALMIDTKTTEQYRNKTASQVVEDIAGKHGLTAVVHATTERVGTFYQIDHVRQHHARTEWDLITWLAREQDYVAYVTGRELHFEPRPDASQDPYLFELQKDLSGNFTKIGFEKDLQLAKGIRVEVRAFSGRRNRTVVKTAGTGGHDATVYRISAPGLTPDQAAVRAQALYNELSHHVVKLTIEGPADNLLKISDVISVRGTDFDQVFFPDTISRHMSGDGYVWNVSAKNKPDLSGADQPLDQGDSAGTVMPAAPAASDTTSAATDSTTDADAPASTDPTDANDPGDTYGGG